MNAERVLETCIYAEDLDAAEKFYRDVMGLRFMTRVKGRHVFFFCGSGVFLIFNPAETIKPFGDAAHFPTHGAQGPGHVAFAATQAELPAWREHLHRHGIPIETEMTWPTGGKSIYFRDPAGNSVELATPLTWGLK